LLSLFLSSSCLGKVLSQRKAVNLTGKTNLQKELEKHYIYQHLISLLILAPMIKKKPQAFVNHVDAADPWGYWGGQRVGISTAYEHLSPSGALGLMTARALIPNKEFMQVPLVRANRIRS